MNYKSKDLKEMANAVRAWAVNAVRAAGSGHIGIVLGAADIITVIYANYIRRGRDRFVLSPGHGSALLYAVLKLAGYNVGNLNAFRRVGGLPGHPEFGIDGVDATTGPLGNGVGNAVGMALAEKRKQTDSMIYCLCSDGDLMEGVANEAVAFAGQYQLDNLVLLWDDNGVSIDGSALVDFNVPARMMAAGWRVYSVDGNDVAQINRALYNARRVKGPVFIQCKTEIGFGSSVAGTNKAHGLAISDKEMESLGQMFASATGDDLWRNVAMEQTATVLSEKSLCLPNVTMPVVEAEVSTRELSAIYLNELLRAGADVVGGSADLGGSTGARVAASVDIVPGDFKGNYINYGVREAAMAAIMNGMAISGLRVYGSTFLVFSDYMRPNIRLAALSKLPVVFVFSHDSVAVGEDGPTHQPVEQLASLRLIPNLNVFRPCNVPEIMYSWRRALTQKDKPTAIILSRQKFKQISTPLGADFDRGAYVIHSAKSVRVAATILATGSEVPLAIEVAKKLGSDVQVVSVISVADFRRQKPEYKQQILRGFVVAIEAAASAPWFEFADAVVGIDDFGMSGPGQQVYHEMGFDTDAIVADLKAKI